MSVDGQERDERLDQRIREVARSLDPPPPTPHEAMWRAIAARRAAARPAPRPSWIPWAAAAAVLLATGIGIGRISAPAGSSAPALAAAEERRINPTAYRLATQEHLARAEAFLTLFRASLERPGDHRLASATARQLLSGNRLLLDSPAGSDPKTRLLLEDLELVLAEIAQLSPGSPREDLELIREGMERGDMLPRLRTAAPVRAASTQGAS
jgi:hypothetical protein